MKKDTCKKSSKLFTLLVIAVSIAGVPGASSTASETNNKPTVAEAQKAYNQFITEMGKGGKGGAWKDPEKILPEVRFDGVPITDVSDVLRDEFNNDFDILVPVGQKDGWDWTTTQITLRLKSVTAGEIFNAMNLVFASARTPLH